MVCPDGGSKGVAVRAISQVASEVHPERGPVSAAGPMHSCARAERCMTTFEYETPRLSPLTGVGHAQSAPAPLSAPSSISHDAVMISTVAHDLKTPLAALQAVLGFVLDDRDALVQLATRARAVRGARLRRRA